MPRCKCPAYCLVTEECRRLLLAEAGALKGPSGKQLANLRAPSYMVSLRVREPRLAHRARALGRFYFRWRLLVPSGTKVTIDLAKLLGPRARLRWGRLRGRRLRSGDILTIIIAADAGAVVSGLAKTGG